MKFVAQEVLGSIIMGYCTFTPTTNEEQRVFHFGGPR